MKTLAVFSALLLAAAALSRAQETPSVPVVVSDSADAPAPVRVATIFAQNAIVSTQEGRNATALLNTRYQPRKDAFERAQRELQALRDQLKRGVATMNAEAVSRLDQAITAKSKEAQRLGEDSQTALEEDEGSLLQELGDKLLRVIGEYAQSHGYAVVLDVSNPQGPVLWASPSVDITNEIVKLYDQTHPAAAVPPATSPVTRPPAAPPAARPAGK